MAQVSSAMLTVVLRPAEPSVGGDVAGDVHVYASYIVIAADGIAGGSVTFLARVSILFGKASAVTARKINAVVTF